MRRYKILVLMLLLSLTPLKAEVIGVGSFGSTVSTLEKGLTLMRYDTPLEIRRGGKGMQKFIRGIRAEIRNPTLKGILKYMSFGLFFSFMIFFRKKDE